MLIVPLTQYWIDNFVHEKHSVCTLCGNTGMVDTRTTAVTPAGINVGRLQPCLCPNGQTIRAKHKNVSRSC